MKSCGREDIFGTRSFWLASFFDTLGINYQFVYPQIFFRSYNILRLVRLRCALAYPTTEGPPTAAATQQMLVSRPPATDVLMYEIIFPMMCFSEADAELWKVPLDRILLRKCPQN